MGNLQVSQPENCRSDIRSSSDWNWIVHRTCDLLALHAAEHIIATAANAIARSGAFHFVATGGETVRRIYNLVASSPSMDWQAWHVYLTDERCAPDGSELRNSTMLSREFLDRVGIPKSQVHLIPGELGATAAAQAYACEVGAVEAFDLVLMGLGEDGHVASLFPGGTACGAWVVPVFDSPKPPAERVSLAPAMLQRARQTLLVVSGRAKRRALMGIGAEDSLFRRAIGEDTCVTVFADNEAAPDDLAVSTE